MKWAVVIALVSGIGLSLVGSASAAEQTFTVTRSGDSQGDGCAVNGCTLREAINAANANANPGELDVVHFAPSVIGGTIEVKSLLPQITQTVKIDGCNSQPTVTAPCTGLRYAGTGPHPDAFQVNGAIITLRGFAITNFGFGINGGFASIAVNITDNWLGARLDGSAEPNTFTSIATAADSTFIARNVVVSSGAAGIAVNGADNVTIRGNRIGVSAAGAARGNASWGVLVQPFGADPATNVTIGGNTAAEENLVSNNGDDAIAIRDNDNRGVKKINVLRNRGIRNGGLFLDLEPFDGVGTSSVIGPNSRIEDPAITAATNEAASGTAEPGATVRVFRKVTNAAGRLDVFVGRTTASPTGAWSLTYSKALPLGQFIAATQTVSAKGTSELSPNVAYAEAP